MGTFQSEQLKRNWLEIVYQGIIWAFVGALYAALFIPVFEVVLSILPLWAAPVCATVAATAGSALVYSSSQLALLVGIFSNFAVFVYLLYSGEFASPLAPITVGAGIGAVVGAIYGHIVKDSRIYRAEAKLLAGATVGIVVSSISLIWVFFFKASVTILVVVLAPLSGLIYVKILKNFIQRYSDVLPPIADGAMAGVVIGGFIGFGLWVMGGIVLQNAAGGWQDTIATVADSTPAAIAATALSTLLMGMLREAFRFKF